MFFLIVAVSLAVLAAQNAFPGPACTVDGSSYPWTQCYLGASTRTPWGIFTAFFVHTSYQYHYLPNMVMLFGLVFVFVATNAFVPLEEKGFRQRVFIHLMFLAGMAANVASLFLYGPFPTVGASGLDFAAWGLTLVFCVTNLVPRIESRKDLFPYYRNAWNLASTLGNFVVAFVLIYAPVQYPALFLVVAPGVNVLDHFVGIVFAMVVAIPWTVYARARPRAAD